MELTTFLAQIWGPVLFAVGVGIFVSRPYYIRIYRDLDKDTLAVLTFGLVAMAAGIAHISSHSVWDTLPQIIISLLGWGLLLKGAVFIILPKFVDQKGDWMVKSKLLPLVGAVLLVFGGYLSWLGYLN